MRVLDIGCGTGGSAFYMARKFGVEVLGVDLSGNMLAIANEHRAEMEPEVANRVTFRYLDATKAVFPPNYFDVMYSRDAIMHIAEKEVLYKKVFEWLKPGGQLLVSEYIHGPGLKSQEYIDYIIDRGYQLVTVWEYSNILERSGFEEVTVIENTDKFVDILKEETGLFRKQRSSFIKEFSERDYDDIVDGWKVKVQRCAKGEQGWGLFMATK
jgi:phosphoethanolamine N-methyltransferase